MIRRGVTFVALMALLFQSYTAATACGPSYLLPIFVFEDSPDLPFKEFTAGKIGIVKPSFGRKTLVIAYRYLNGGSFGPEEQQQLVSVLNGEPPEEKNDEALKAWISLRKELAPREELPEIYLTERTTPFGGYDYFPNCTKNAFEVATATLKDRANTYGPDDANVREWTRGQDEVFRNCSGGAPTIPRALGGEAPTWLRKDRDYQIAAALFYSLQFDEAVAHFQKIAADGESKWQSTAEYLIARALVRHASLTDDAAKKSTLYAKAETQLQPLVSGSGQFRDASRKLLGLIKYRTVPEARVAELAELVSAPGASPDLRQDVIDYVWLLDKFEAEARKKEHERREALKQKEIAARPISEPWRDVEAQDEREGKITVSFYPEYTTTPPDFDFRNIISVRVPLETPDIEILRLVEERLNRKLTEEETSRTKYRIESTRAYRRWSVSYNLKVARAAHTYDGNYFSDDVGLTLDIVPSFLLANDLTDWIFTLQLDTPATYAHAAAKWRETESPAWLVAALSMAEPGSRDVHKLMRAAERVGSDAPSFPSLAFHLVRLKIALGQTNDAQQLLEKVETTFDQLPVSAQNEFRKQRTELAGSLAQFLKYAARKPVAFYAEGLFLTIRELVDARKSYWSDYEGQEESREEYENRVEREHQHLLGDDLTLFNEETAEIVDRHFSLEQIQQAASDAQLSRHLRRQLTLVAWTRALLLKKHDVAIKIAPAVIKAAPEMKPLVTDYVEAKTLPEREQVALYILVKSPRLTPFISVDLQFFEIEVGDYYFGSAWWCQPSDTDYNRDGEATKKTVPAPAFLGPGQLNIAKQEFEELSRTGDAKSYLGKRVLEWARTSPEDPRIPEALYIAFAANQSYKYGCGGWEHDQDVQNEAAALLRERYPSSPWTAKLPPPD